LPDQEEFVSSRTKTAWGLLISLAFVATSAAAEAAGDTNWKLRGGLILFGISSLMCAWLMVRPHRLKLDPQGFTLSGGLLRSPKKTLWHDVGEFYVRRLRPGANMVAFTYAPEAKVPFGGSLGRSGGLPGMWPGGPEEVAWRLNQYREAILAQR